MIDLAIIGSGPAGLTAAIYAARAGLRFVLLEQDGYGGGQISSAHLVQNYPGVPEVSGFDLGEALRQQALDLGAEVTYGTVSLVEQIPEGFSVHLADEEAPVQARVVIAATGASPRPLGVPGETEHIGSGVSYCATCDGSFYRGKNVAVVGGGDTAVEDGIYLSSICSSVTLLLRRDQFRAAQRRVEVLEKLPNVTIRFKVKPTAVEDKSLVLDTENGPETLPVDGVFIAVGSQPATAYLQQLPLTLEGGYVAADETCKTAIPGLYAAGDIRKKQLRQVVTAVADGANAVTSALEYLRG
ncbi:MAG: FAD-dependent oxidoreductase [Oscillospiraceae bacterium]|nr:FAD-dependent oxidoreductase [Oscillospiraceae bacterium]